MILFHNMLSQHRRLEEANKRRRHESKTNCLFNQEFVQALHETLDVLSDYNKDTRLNYNEYVILQNKLLVYNYLK